MTGLTVLRRDDMMKSSLLVSQFDAGDSSGICCINPSSFNLYNFSLKLNPLSRVFKATGTYLIVEWTEETNMLRQYFNFEQE